MLTGTDRSGWPPGPWDGEPDRADWRHAGLPCFAKRNQLGSWCGYAGVPPGHPFYGKHYDDVDVDVHVHGGITYARSCSGDLCHEPAPGEPDDVWWFGFDCSHAFDLTPGIMARLQASSLWPLGERVEHYWTLNEVRAETNRLAEQLAR